MKTKIRVLVVDDSALARHILTEGLSKFPEIEVIGAANDPYVARDMIVKHNPDVMTLDVEMPRMNGVEFLRRLMPQKPVPVIMVSSLTQSGGKITFDALDAGAIDFVTKPSKNTEGGLIGMMNELHEKILMASNVDLTSLKSPPYKGDVSHLSAKKALGVATDKIIAIGASTGGTEAIRKVITRLPASTPGIVIVQHMPSGFTTLFAERLNQQSDMMVKEAQDGDRVDRGTVLIAPGDFHVRVIRSGDVYRVRCTQEEKVNGHRPSVEVLFKSVAQYAGSNAVGILLTGMGNDGGLALKKMRDTGARTIAQDEQTSVVFGMPKVAYDCGGAEKLVPIHLIAETILTMLVENT